jgi:predicted Mrr-cat superfamily restriction endonuclease
MKEDKENNLEEKSKEFLKGKIINLKRTSFKLSDVEKLDEQILKIDYLVKNQYIIESGETVKNFHYEITNNGMKWAFT